MTETPHRRRLVPKTTVIAAAVIIVLGASAVLGAFLVSRSRLVEVPDVAGLTASDAERELTDAGLVAARDSSRVSVDVPAGAVISQEPPSGTLLKPGQTVRIILSVGPQTFVVPDLVGSSVDGARDALEALGLKVAVEAVDSSEAPNTVLEMFPAPGASVGRGDVVRLTVPGGSAADSVLLPYALQGLTVLLDPQPVTGGLTNDPPMEVARRLRSLLEAAGATVTTTRPTDAGPPSASDRKASAESSTASILVGLDVGGSGKPGISALYMDRDSAAGVEALAYARAITRASDLPGLVANEPTPSDDPVLAAFPGIGLRVVLGDDNADVDRARFVDPAWLDQVARAIYRGIGTTYAKE
jgi:hypothetical protein